MDNDQVAIDADIKSIQSRIRKGTLILFELSEAIDKMPDSQARNELVTKHGSVLAKIAELSADLSDIDDHLCYYGFSPRCPNCLCEDCPDLHRVMRLNHIQYIDDFDAQRLEKSREYYQERKEMEQYGKTV